MDEQDCCRRMQMMHARVRVNAAPTPDSGVRIGGGRPEGDRRTKILHPARLAWLAHETGVGNLEFPDTRPKRMKLANGEKWRERAKSIVNGQEACQLTDSTGWVGRKHRPHALLPDLAVGQPQTVCSLESRAKRGVLVVPENWVLEGDASFCACLRRPSPRWFSALHVPWR